jgi:beta-phosphoglucomutase-like phosphatase (HAD superfamily)
VAALAALILEVDGTLAETERDGHRVAFKRAFSDAGLDWHRDETEYGRLPAVIGGEERMAHGWAWRDPAPGRPRPTRPSASRTCTSARPASARRWWKPVRSACVTGVERLLRDARSAGVRLAIATTTTPANVESLLHHTPGPSALFWFECIGAGDIAPRKKPAPGIYRHVLAQMSLEPSDCVAIEDSEPGFAAAQAAGIPSLVTRGHHTPAGGFEGAMAVLDGLGKGDRHAAGLALGRPSRGNVDAGTLAAWHHAATRSSPTADNAVPTG